MRAAEPKVEVERVDQQPTAGVVEGQQVEILCERDHAGTVRGVGLDASGDRATAAGPWVQAGAPARTSSRERRSLVRAERATASAGCHRP